MPFDKEPTTAGCEAIGLRTLLLAAFLLATALLFGGIGAMLLAREGAGVIAEAMESEAVHAFLGIATGA